MRRKSEFAATANVDFPSTVHLTIFFQLRRVISTARLTEHIYALFIHDYLSYALPVFRFGETDYYYIYGMIFYVRT